MKTHFLKLFDYDRYANLLILQSILEVNSPAKPVRLMAHLLATQQVWLNRCKTLPVASGAIWPDWTVETFEPIIQNNNKLLISFTNELEADDFSKVIAYQNSKGEKFNNQLSDILTHIINHGTHHRAQIGQHLKLAGLPTLPVTDYIIYLRDRNL